MRGTVWQRVRQWLARSEMGHYLVRVGLADAAGMSAGYRAYASEGYAQNVYAYRCIRLRGLAMGSLTWRVYRRGNAGQQTAVAAAHPLCRLLRRPNPHQGWSAFMQRAMLHLDLDGNAFLRFVGPAATGDDAPRMAFALPPDRVLVQAGAQLADPHRYLFDNAPLSAAQVLHLWYEDPLNELRGLSPLCAAALSIDTNTAERRFRYNLLKNSAMPSGIYRVQGRLQEPDYERLKKELRDKYAGAERAGSVMLLQNGAEFQAVGFSPKEFFSGTADPASAVEIAEALAVPGQLVGIRGSQTFANFAQALRHFYTSTVLGLADYWRDELRNWLVPKYGDDRLELDYDRDAIAALRDEQNAVVERTAQAWWLTVNEKRRATGADPLPGGDALLAPSGMQRVE